MTTEFTNYFRNKRAAIVEEQDVANYDLQKAEVGGDKTSVEEARIALAKAGGKLSLIDQLKTEIVEIVISN